MRREPSGWVSEANAAFVARYPGEGRARQRSHTVYIGADTFRAGTAREHGQVALRALEAYAPTRRPSRARWTSPKVLAATVPCAFAVKLEREPVEDLRPRLRGRLRRPPRRRGRRARGPPPRGDRSCDADPRAAVVHRDSREAPERGRQGAERAHARRLPLDARRRDRRRSPPGFVVTLAKITCRSRRRCSRRCSGPSRRSSAQRAARSSFEIAIEVAQAVLDHRGQPAVRARSSTRGRDAASRRTFGTYDYTW